MREFFSLDDTIVAISTPLGEGGIGIVRLSGKQACDIASKIYQGKKDIKNIPSHTMAYGHIIDPSTKQVIDEVLVSVMKAGKSYTREDVVEINCHGGIIPLKEVLRLAITGGARLAKPGEFTLRAYLNGRIDLTQAEAVCETIRAKTKLAHKYSCSQLIGRLFKKISQIEEEILDILAEIEAEIDFPEEDISTSSKESLLFRLNLLKENIAKIITTFNYGKVVSCGVVGVIAGRPNVGKSSLMNLMLGHDRVIVSQYPGTTRDIIEEYINVDGIPLKIVDTAGLQKTTNIYEIDELDKKSITMARKAIGQADIIIFVLDSSQALTQLDIDMINKIKKNHKKLLLVINKIDLQQKINLKDLEGISKGEEIVKVSALGGIGVDELYKKLKKILLFEEYNFEDSDELIITNVRHKEILEGIVEDINNACKRMEENTNYMELAAYELKEALDKLNTLTGKSASEDLLYKIFSKFCIGK